MNAIDNTKKNSQISNRVKIANEPNLPESLLTNPSG
jgi:hypothetical protein